MKLGKVLVLHKKSTFQLQALQFRESRFVKLLQQGHEVVTRVKQAHSEHVETLDQVEQELARRKIAYKTVVRSGLSTTIEDVDLVISVGGDGTFLDAAHFLHHVPILGVNSSCSSSFGHLCAANEMTFARILDNIEADTFKSSRLSRLELHLNGELLNKLALNELLIAHSHPAATTRYFISIDGIKEEHRSSGIWIGTATGSSGSIRSAGGLVLPITDSRYQYFVREACLRPNQSWQLLNGILEADKSIRLVSQMRTGGVYVDGPHISYPFSLGDELVVKPSSKVLNAYVSPAVNEIFMTAPV